MSTPPEPRSALDQAVRELASEVNEVTRRLAVVRREAAHDASAIAAEAGALAAAAEELRRARLEMQEQMDALDELLDRERVGFAHLFDWAPDAYLVTNGNGKILEANRQAERLFGCSRRLLLNSFLQTMLPQDQRPAFRAMLRRIPRLHVIADWELDLRRRDGGSVPAATTVSWVPDRQGGGGILRWLIRDVSERKEIEQQIVSANLELERRVRDRTAELEATDAERQETLARLQAVLRQIPAAIVIADARTGKIVTANQHAEGLLGQVAGEASLDSWLSIGRRPGGELIPEEDRPLVRALRDGEIVSGEQIQFDRLDGTTGVFEVSSAPVRAANGEVVAAVSAYWDVTDRERRARAEREFITNAAHELRTPLAALSSAVDVLQAGAKERAEDRNRFLQHVEQQCTRLQQLVRSLLLLARVQTGHEAAETEPIAAAELLHQVAQHAPSDRVRVDVDGIEGLRVLANRDLAERALANLLANASKYAPNGDIVLEGAREDGYVSLEVVDSGPGIQADERSRVVERFYRGGRSGDVEGFGLGLSITSQVAEALRGRLELEQTDAGGTRARLLLPAADA